MSNDFSSYGLWSLVVLNSVVFIMFIFSFFKPKSAVSIHRNSIDTGKMRRSSLDPTFLLA